MAFLKNRGCLTKEEKPRALLPLIWPYIPDLRWSPCARLRFYARVCYCCCPLNACQWVTQEATLSNLHKWPYSSGRSPTHNTHTHTRGERAGGDGNWEKLEEVMEGTGWSKEEWERDRMDSGVKQLALSFNVCSALPARRGQSTPDKKGKSFSYRV